MFHFSFVSIVDIIATISGLLVPFCMEAQWVGLVGGRQGELTVGAMNVYLVSRYNMAF